GAIETVLRPQASNSLSSIVATFMSSPVLDFAQLKSGMKSAWMAGDFGQIANHTAEAAAEFVERIAIPSGSRVLDVACGTGNTTIPAARTGASVTGVDIASNLLAQARQRAVAENLDIRFEEGDAENLPFPDRSFDIVLSMFGAMFGPRPERVAAELLRVCKPGGVIAMANWTPEGFVGKSFQITGKMLPPPPGLPAPVLWGDEATVRRRLSPGASSFKLIRQKIWFHYPFSPGKTVEFFRQYFGPTYVAFSRLDQAGQADLAARLESLWSEHNTATDGTTRVEAEYLDVRAIRA
ncbi:MAG: class I SAM-dependent methyltransferase, partial [Candidatus Sulfotelmatobacter sp.]